MKRLYKSIIPVFGLSLAVLAGPDAYGQTTPEYTVRSDNPVQINTFDGISAPEYASLFIALSQGETGIPIKDYQYDPENIESLRLYIWTRLEDKTVDLSGVVDRFDRIANEVEDARNIKIAAMVQGYLKIRDDGTLSDTDFDSRMSELTRPFANDNDWFVVFFANSLNYEAATSRGLGVYDPLNTQFAEWALRGHESDLDYDEAKLIHLRMMAIEYIRRWDISGYFRTLEARNKIKVKLGLPDSNFADLINAAQLHHQIFYDPSSIRIAEEAFLNDPVSSDDQGKYVLAQVYTAHGFADKALEVYKNINIAALGGDGALEDSIQVDKAFNYLLLGDFDEAERLLASVSETDVGDHSTAKLDFDLLTLTLHQRVMTPEKKADLLTARKSIHNVLTQMRLEGLPEETTHLFETGGTIVSVDTNPAHIWGNPKNLLPVSEVDQARIDSFISLAANGLNGSSAVKPADKMTLTALRAYSGGRDQALTEILRDLSDEPGGGAIAELVNHYGGPQAHEKVQDNIRSTEPELATLEYIIRARACLKVGDFAGSWAQYYQARNQVRSVAKAGLSDFLLADLELLLLSYENDAERVLAGASQLFEKFGQYIPDAETGYDIVNRTAIVFERTGRAGMAHRIITLDGKAGMAQPYANHMTEARLMLAMAKYREAKDRLSTLLLEEGTPLRQTLNEKALSYAAHAALGETTEALSLAQNVRTGLRGLNDGELAALVKPYLYLGDYHVYTYYRPFEAEQYRARYLNLRRQMDIAQTDQSRQMAEARVRAVNATEMRSLERAETELGSLRSRLGAMSSTFWLMLAGLLGGAYGLFRLFRQNRALTAENAQLDHARRTHEYFMDEMERQTALETTALNSAMDTMARSSGTDPALMSEKLSGHVTSLKETIARLAFQDRVFTRGSSTPTKINLEILRKELIESWQPAASKKDISIMFDVDERVRSVHSYKSLLAESLRLFVGHAIDHTSIDVITVKMTPFRIKDQDFVRATISDEGDGLASFDARLSPGDVSPNLHVAFDDSEKRAFAASTAIMAINGAGGRFESQATPGFGHVLTFDLPATLLAGADEPTTPSNIIEFKKGTANDG